MDVSSQDEWTGGKLRQSVGHPAEVGLLKVSTGELGEWIQNEYLN
jgi:hypothetical protein